MAQWVGLRAGSSQARIAPLGAEVQALQLHGLELLRTPDAHWAAISPVLFPIVGWARDGQIRVDGQAYPMGVHGFAASLTFQIARHSDTQVVFATCDTPKTRAHYPFAFGLRVSYTLAQNGLDMVLEVTNPGGVVLPYACGFHPGFRLPFAGGRLDDYGVEFAAREAPHVPVIAPGGLFSSEMRDIPLQGRNLPLSEALLAQEALCFLNARSQSLTLSRQHGPRLQITLENFPHLALWGRPPSPFVCIEAWTGHGDPVGFAGELIDKPAMRHLMPGETARHRMRIELVS